MKAGDGKWGAHAYRPYVEYALAADEHERATS